MVARLLRSGNERAMQTPVFINFPVADLGRATHFYAAIGFGAVPALTTRSMACLIGPAGLGLMLLTPKAWARFTPRPPSPAGTSETMIALPCASRAEVDRLTGLAVAAGGVADPNPVQDLPVMYSRSFADPDGHIWETMWLDPAVLAG
ncbi:VOC family protein [Sphingomonas changnyeongensis]|nr:lactoylglutathione lyase [Sphingomonas changnyeongensis]